MSTTNFKGAPVKVAGKFIEKGAVAPDFALVKTDLSSLSLKDLKGKNVVLNIFPSLDTSVCATSVRKFNKLAAGLPDTVVLAVSKDLPFAHGTFFNLTAVHLTKKLKALCDGAVTIRTFHTRLGRSTFLLSYLFGRLLVNISFSFLNKADGEIPELLEIIGCIIFITPLVTQPLNVFLDCFHVFHIFLCRVGVVEA